MNRLTTALGTIAICLVLGYAGLSGPSELEDQQRAEAHRIETLRAAQQEAALRRQAEWAMLLHKGQRMTGFPQVAGK